MEVAVNFLVERLLEVGRENVELIVGVQDDVDSLVSDLRGLKAFLKDASKIERDTEGWRQAVKDVRVVVYKAEDAIDKFLVEAKKHLELHPATRWADVPYWRSVKNVAKEIRSIGTRVKELSDKYNPILESVRNEPPPNPTLQHREQNLAEDDDVVGFDEEANTVIRRLIEGSTELEAVPIVGMAGLGKSTLAKKVFKDSRVTFEFFNCIWVSVSRNTKKDVLLEILCHFKKRSSELEHMSEDQLTDEIRSCIEKGGRCLIMLDDVWEANVMDYVKHVFPKNNKNHRIMLTSRELDVASYFHDNIHKLKFLEDDESWLLLRKKVFRKERCPSDELVEPGKTIAKKCSGLPLAIVVIAGALIGKMTKREWQLVLQTIGERLISRTDPRSCLGFVKMSYDMLSYDAKTCFLYCATFPKSSEIPAWKLIRLWIAEGFILYDKNLTLEEKAEICLSDLTKKNLVMAMKRTSNGQVKTCRVHDMLYDFCKKEASEDDLFQEISPGRDQPAMMVQDSSIYRRLCIESSNLEDFLSSISKKQSIELVRSFLCFSVKQTDQIPATAVKTIHKAFPMLRVLDVESLKFVFTRDFYQLMHLKYVAFSGDFNSLPEVFKTKLWNLETIIINTSASDNNFVIKADIWSMLRLRHLHTNVAAVLPSPGAATGKDCCIQTLSAISPESCTKEIFSRSRYLRKLGIQGDVRSLLDTNTGGQSNFAELKRLERLEKLKIIHKDQKGANTNTNTGKVIILPKLVFIFSSSLKQLSFSGTGLEWSEVSKLAQLECLEVLKLKENAFKGDFWETDNGGFTNLLVLLIERTDLKTWRASKNSFPSLKRLILRSCEDLVEIPDSLGAIDNFQEMRLENCHKTAVKSAKDIQKKKVEMQLKIKEEQERSADENKLDRPTGFSVGFKISVFPPDSDA